VATLLGTNLESRSFQGGIRPRKVTGLLAPG